MHKKEVLLFTTMSFYFFFLFHIHSRVPQIIMNVVNSNKMNKPFDFITSSFAANLSDTYSISIRQLPDGYNFYITNDKNESVAIKHIAAEHITPALLADEPLLQLNYRSATYIGHGVFSMIPQNLIIDNNYTAFLSIESNLRLRAKTIANPINSDIIIACYTNQWTIPFIDTRKKTRDRRTLNTICCSTSLRIRCYVGRNNNSKHKYRCHKKPKTSPRKHLPNYLRQRCSLLHTCLLPTARTLTRRYTAKYFRQYRDNQSFTFP